MQGQPINAVMAAAKNELRAAVMEIKRESGLPAYLIGSLVGEIRGELAQDEIADLIATLTTKSQEVKEENADQPEQ